MVTDPLNLTKTQDGYVPLGDRFKSFPADSEKQPQSDQEFYFDNYANQTLEHADLGLILPIPDWLRQKLIKQGLVGGYRIVVSGKLRICRTLEGGTRFRVYTVSA